MTSFEVIRLLNLRSLTVASRQFFSNDPDHIPDKNTVNRFISFLILLTSGYSVDTRTAFVRPCVAHRFFSSESGGSKDNSSPIRTLRIHVIVPSGMSVASYTPSR
uniref:Uncharacterized protein n=1 Tax=Schistocephalus solidus TaxID=70667 RepID=A0A0X3PC05_SCHSO